MYLTRLTQLIQSAGHSSAWPEVYIYLKTPWIVALVVLTCIEKFCLFKPKIRKKTVPVPSCMQVKPRPDFFVARSREVRPEAKNFRYFYIHSVSRLHCAYSSFGLLQRVLIPMQRL